MFDGGPGNRVSSESRPATPADQLHLACRLVKDLLKPKAHIFWTDMLASWAVGVAAFVASVWLPAGSVPMLVAFLVAVLAWYRASVFIHEIAHQKPGDIPGFRPVWNVLVGVPLLLPSIFYEGSHSNHHRRTTYGTLDDPEYQYLSGRRGWIIVSALGGFFAPLLLAGRFLLLGPPAFVIPPLHRWLEAAASAYVINPWYRRKMTVAERRRLHCAELMVLGGWAAILALAWFDIIPVKALLLWAGIYMLVSFLNHMRMLAAHRFHSEWQPTNQLGQFLDSIDTPGGPWTELWAPVGLRYHALHHLMPTLPYHELGPAYRRLVRELPKHTVYLDATSPSMANSLNVLWTGSTHQPTKPEA